VPEGDVLLPRPPVPLPVHPEIMFLATTRALVREGEQMHHCIATRIPQAMTAEAYLFHVEHQGQRASVEISGTGHFVEAKGPCNRENAASRFGATFLARWGVGVRAAKLLADLLSTTPAMARTIAAPLGPPLRPGERPLRTLDELVAVLPWVDARSVSLWDFLARVLPQCRRSTAGGEGRRWLVVEARDGPMVGLLSLTRSGRVERWIGGDPRAGRPLALHGPPRGSDDDDDDDREAALGLRGHGAPGNGAPGNGAPGNGARAG